MEEMKGKKRKGRVRRNEEHEPRLMGLLLLRINEQSDDRRDMPRCHPEGMALHEQVRRECKERQREFEIGNLRFEMECGRAVTARGEEEKAAASPFGAQGEPAHAEEKCTATNGCATKLGRAGVGLFGIYVQVFGGFLHYRRRDFSFVHQLDQGGVNDEARIYLKEIAERGAAFAAAESVCAERDEAARRPPADEVRERLQIVRGRDEDAGRVGQDLGDVGDARLFAGMEDIPALGVETVVVKLLIAGDAPDIGGDAVIFFENLLRVKGFEEDCSAAEKLGAEF